MNEPRWCGQHQPLIAFVQRGQRRKATTTRRGILAKRTHRARPSIDRPSPGESMGSRSSLQQRPANGKHATNAHDTRMWLTCDRQACVMKLHTPKTNSSASPTKDRARPTNGAPDLPGPSRRRLRSPSTAVPAEREGDTGASAGPAFRERAAGAAEGMTNAFPPAASEATATTSATIIVVSFILYFGCFRSSFALLFADRQVVC